MCAVWDSALLTDWLHWTDGVVSTTCNPPIRRRPGRSRNRASLVTAGWLVLGMAVGLAGLVLATTWLRRNEQVDLGSVSHQWIAEQRAGQAYDSQR
jgi:hypothetical protein